MVEFLEICVCRVGPSENLRRQPEQKRSEIVKFSSCFYRLSISTNPNMWNLRVNPLVLVARLCGMQLLSRSWSIAPLCCEVGIDSLRQCTYSNNRCSALSNII